MPNSRDILDKGRRMSDRTVPLTNAEQAVRMSELEADQRMLQLQLKTSIEGVTHSVNNVQLDVRALSNKLGELVSLQHQADTAKDTMQRVEASIEDIRRSFATSADQMRKSFEDWMHESETKSSDKWLRHEAENKETRDQVIRWGGIGFAVILLGGAIVSGFVAMLNMRFNQEAEARADLRRAVDENRTMYLQRADTNAKNIEANKDRLHQIELYIAQGGKVPLPQTTETK